MPDKIEAVSCNVTHRSKVFCYCTDSAVFGTDTSRCSVWRRHNKVRCLTPTQHSAVLDADTTRFGVSRRHNTVQCLTPTQHREVLDADTTRRSVWRRHNTVSCLTSTQNGAVFDADTTLRGAWRRHNTAQCLTPTQHAAAVHPNTTQHNTTQPVPTGLHTLYSQHTWRLRHQLNLWHIKVRPCFWNLSDKTLYPGTLLTSVVGAKYPLGTKKSLFGIAPMFLSSVSGVSRNLELSSLVKGCWLFLKMQCRFPRYSDCVWM